MILHKYIDPSTVVNYALFNREERLVELPTSYLRALRQQRRSNASQRQIANVLKLHCQWIEENESFSAFEIDQVIQHLVSEEILDWINDQRTAGLYENTIHNRELLAREFYRWLTTAQAGRARDEIPWGTRTFTRQAHPNLPRFVTMEQVTRLLNALHNESQRVACHFLYDTGIRVSELARLTNDLLPNERDYPDDVNYYPLLIPGSKSRDSRKPKYRFTIISRPMLARLQRYHATPQYLFAKGLSLYHTARPAFLNIHSQHLSITSIQKAINAAWKRQGGGPREMSAHRLRHGTAISILCSELGQELHDNFLILKNMLGHARIRSTEIYAAIPIAALRSLTRKQQARLKYEEAQQIFDATYLPGHLHREKRGHRK
jgi:integrase/recombinase XerD